MKSAPGTKYYVPELVCVCGVVSFSHHVVLSTQPASLISTHGKKRRNPYILYPRVSTRERVGSAIN